MAGGQAARHSETPPPFAENQAAGASLDGVFREEIDGFHGIELPSSHKHPTLRWFVDPAWGKGSYWYCCLDEAMAVSAFDVEFCKDVELAQAKASLFCLGLYSRSMQPYLGKFEDPQERRVLGYAWNNSRDDTMRVRAGQHLEAVVITLAPKALRRISLECNCDPVLACSALLDLDGEARIPRLVSVFDELRSARPCAVTARALYRAKIIEAFALVIEAHLCHRPLHRVSVLESAALDRAREVLHESTGRLIGLEELSRIAQLSPGRLSTLFKQVEGCTPSAYALRARLSRACDLLAKTDQPLADIAAQLGYRRQGSFSEAFKTRYGLTPIAYRRSAR